MRRQGSHINLAGVIWRREKEMIADGYSVALLRTAAKRRKQADKRGGQVADGMPRFWEHLDSVPPAATRQA